jgi:hypothetical protein
MGASMVILKDKKSINLGEFDAELGGKQLGWSQLNDALKEYMNQCFRMDVKISFKGYIRWLDRAGYKLTKIKCLDKREILSSKATVKGFKILAPLTQGGL